MSLINFKLFIDKFNKLIKIIGIIINYFLLNLLINFNKIEKKLMNFYLKKNIKK